MKQVIYRSESNMTFEKFGPFASAFESLENEAPAYRALLHLVGIDAATALSRVREAVQIPNWEPYALELLLDPNWRTHLVAGCALLYMPSEKVLPALWQALDAGSWVAPQLAVVGYFSDAKFVERAKFRVETGCPVTPPQGLDAVERHSATGPAGTAGRSAKNIASLLNMCARIAELSPWVAEIQTELDVRQMLKLDESMDRSACITEHWFQRISQLFESQGLTLSPAYQQ